MAGTTYTVIVSNGISFNYTGIYDVTAYGAVGDGLAEDSGAIQAAIDAAEAAGGGKVFFPAGEYLAAAAELTVTGDDIWLCGAGRASKIISSTAVATNQVSISGAGCKVSDMAFVGGATTSSGVAGNANECIELTADADSTEITSVWFLGTSATAGYNVCIRGRSGLKGTRIVGNYFERIIGTAPSWGYGVQFAGVSDSVVNDNIFIQSATTGRHCIYLTDGCTDVTCGGNVVEGAVGEAMTMYSLNSQDAVVGCKFHDNTINGLSGFLSGTWGLMSMVENINNCSIENNIITDSGANGIKLEANSGAASTCINNKVSDNTINGANLHGIVVSGAQGCEISGNKITDASQSVTATNAGIYLGDNGSALCDDTVVIGNTVRGSDHKWAISCDGVGSSYINNRLEGGTTSVFNGIVAADAGKFWGNIFDNDPLVTAGATPHTAAEGEEIILVDGGGAAYTVDIPATLKWPGNRITVKDVGGDAGTYNITIDPSGAGVNDATSNGTISTNYGSMSLVYKEVGGVAAWWTI